MKQRHRLLDRLIAGAPSDTPEGNDNQGSAAMITLTDAIPVLRIFDVPKALEFYVDFLGFKVDWEHRFAADLPLYAQISRSGLRLHLSEHHGDASPGSTVFIWMRGLKAYQAELAAKTTNTIAPASKPHPGTRSSWK